MAFHFLIWHAIHTPFTVHSPPICTLFVLHWDWTSLWFALQLHSIQIKIAFHQHSFCELFAIDLPSICSPIHSHYTPFALKLQSICKLFTLNMHSIHTLFALHFHSILHLITLHCTSSAPFSIFIFIPLTDHTHFNSNYSPCVVQLQSNCTQFTHYPSVICTTLTLHFLPFCTPFTHHSHPHSHSIRTVFALSFPIIIPPIALHLNSNCIRSTSVS